jgi:8-oxo-dGTP diphosphatase
MSASVFNIRVYGLLIHNSQLLIAEQFYKNRLLRKFPGGGLDFGEGLIDGLKREFMEELSLDIEVTGHYYTTDFFVASVFHENNQVISVFYKVMPSPGSEMPMPVNHRIPDKELEEVFRWVPLAELNKEEFTFPIEKRVAALLYNDFINNTI